MTKAERKRRWRIRTIAGLLGRKADSGGVVFLDDDTIGKASELDELEMTPGQLRGYIRRYAGYWGGRYIPAKFIRADPRAFNEDARQDRWTSDKYILPSED